MIQVRCIAGIGSKYVNVRAKNIRMSKAKKFVF